MFNLVTNRCIRYCQSEKEISVSRGNSIRNAGGGLKWGKGESGEGQEDCSGSEAKACWETR